MPEGALQRAVELLGRLGERPTELTVAELASDAGMPTSTAYRLLAELEQHGLVQRGPDRTVALGTRLVALGRTAEEALRERLVEPGTGGDGGAVGPAGGDHDPDRAVRAGGDRPALGRDRAPLGPALIHRCTGVRRCTAALPGKILAAYLDGPERERLLAAVGSPSAAAASCDGSAATGSRSPSVSSMPAPPRSRRRSSIAAGGSPPDCRWPDRPSASAADPERLRPVVLEAAQTIERAYQS